jgi:glutathione S-transferase
MYDLAIGDRIYSSWSLRGWLLFERFGLPVRTTLMQLYADNWLDRLAALAPARTVPALRLPGGVVVGDSLAIAEELASRHPEVGIWPADPAARARARWLAAEMHSGFAALRGTCPMNLRDAYSSVPVPDAVRADLDRIEALWAHARSHHRDSGPWLFGRYSAADVFFAPVAARIAAYGLPVGPEASDYVMAHLADPAFRRWRAQGLAEGKVLAEYKMPHVTRPWPAAPALAATAVEGTQAENAACPYSGNPVTHVLEFRDRRFGFCNRVCRDKTASDPEVWPKFMALVGAEVVNAS